MLLFSWFTGYFNGEVNESDPETLYVLMIVNKTINLKLKCLSQRSNVIHNWLIDKLLLSTAAGKKVLLFSYLKPKPKDSLFSYEEINLKRVSNCGQFNLPRPKTKPRATSRVVFSRKLKKYSLSDLSPAKAQVKSIIFNLFSPP